MTIKCETARVTEPRAREEGRGKLVANGRGGAKVSLLWMYSQRKPAAIHIYEGARTTEDGGCGSMRARADGTMSYLMPLTLHL